MKMTHPTDAHRTKDVPDGLVEKYLAGGWTKAEPDPKPTRKRAAVKRAPSAPASES